MRIYRDNRATIKRDVENVSRLFKKLPPRCEQGRNTCWF